MKLGVQMPAGINGAVRMAAHSLEYQSSPSVPAEPPARPNCTPHPDVLTLPPAMCRSKGQASKDQMLPALRTAMKLGVQMPAGIDGAVRMAEHSAVTIITVRWPAPAKPPAEPTCKPCSRHRRQGRPRQRPPLPPRPPTPPPATAAKA
jgi:hypothetical protein